MAERLGVDRHEERTVGCLTFYVHERKLGNGRFKRVGSLGVSSFLFMVLLPLLVLMLNKFKVVINQVDFFW